MFSGCFIYYFYFQYRVLGIFSLKSAEEFPRLVPAPFCCPGGGVSGGNDLPFSTTTTTTTSPTGERRFPLGCGCPPSMGFGVVFFFSKGKKKHSEDTA